MTESGALPFAPDEVLINEYKPGQGISAHVDKHCFGGTIASISLGSACVMEFTNKARSRNASYCWNRAACWSCRGRHASTGSTQLSVVRKDKVEGQWIARARRISLTFREVIRESK